MTVAPLPYGRHWLDDDDIAAVVKVLRGDWLTQGPAAGEFEASVARFCGAKYAVAFSSGTAALAGAAFAAGLRAGDEVITTPLSFVATANCAVYHGAVPRFADVEAETGNLDPARLDAQATDKTRAVIGVDFAGHPADWDRIKAWAASRKAVVIEDACHALGAEYRGRRVGALCDMTVFSFHPVKHITTGEGGMVLTDNPEYRRKLTLFRSHGVEKPPAGADKGPWYYEMRCLGHNHRLTDMQCALGLSQMNKLEKFLERRRAIAARYDEAFRGMKHLRPLGQQSHVRSAYHLYVVQIDFAALGRDRAAVMNSLREKGVGTQVHYMPIPWHPFYRENFDCAPGAWPVAEGLYNRFLSLPLFPKMSDEDAARVIQAVREVAG